MFSRKVMFKRAEQMEVAWSKVGAIRRMLEDFLLLLLHDNARPHTAKCQFLYETVIYHAVQQFSIAVDT
jgi:hypothetical protein